MRPSVPTSHPALGVAKATAQKPLTPGKREPRGSLVGSPCRSSVIGGNDHRAAKVVPGGVTGSAHVAQAEDRSCHRRRVGKSPGLTAIARNRGARVIRIGGIQITAAYNPAKRITEINGKRARARRTYQRRVIRVPSVASVSGGQHPGNVRSTRANPRVPPALCRDACTTRREGGFARQRWRHIVTDILPRCSVGSA